MALRPGDGILKSLTIPLVFVTLLLQACRVEWGAPSDGTAKRTESARSQVTIYTSAYPPTVAGLSEAAKVALPDVSIEWFQAGSEKIAARLDAELTAGAPGADLLMTSDPTYYERLKARAVFHPYASVRALKLDRRLVDRDGAFVACRLSVMGLVHGGLPGPAPQSFADLFEARFNGRVTLPDPLGSGTMLSSLLVWEQLGRTDIASALRRSRATSSGGGTAVLDRIVRGEALVGVALFENVALAKKTALDTGAGAEHAANTLRFVVPKEGAVVVPGQLAILSKTANLAAAQRVYDFLLSESAQRVMIAHALHSPFDDLPAPQDGPSLQSLPLQDWAKLAPLADAAKRRWQTSFLAESK